MVVEKTVGGLGARAAPGERGVVAPSETSTKGGLEATRSLLTGFPSAFLPLLVTAPAQSCL